MKKVSIFLVFFYIQTICVGQQVSVDSTLQEIVIQAYVSNKPLVEIPAAISYITVPELNRFSNTSLLPAVNTIPGVRMEERSPGSYRLSIRGSLLRSPFGVRNVKIYWNGIPFTDAGGNTYINLIDFGAVNNLEVIKGPGGSIYGAGTGGVMLVNSGMIKESSLRLSSVVGDFGLVRYNTSWEVSKENFTMRIQYAHQQSDGYRRQSAMVRDALNADVNFFIDDKNALSAHFLYTDLFYQTPGGLTPEQHNADPVMARPAAGMFSGAVEQNASISNRTPLAALTYEREWTEQTKSKVSLFGLWSGFKNPAIVNFEEREEENYGARTETSFKRAEHKLTVGAEVQHFGSLRDVYGNRSGSRDTVQTKDKLNADQALLFTQADFSFGSFNVTLGLGLNHLKYSIERLEIDPIKEQETNYNKLSPRLAVLKKLKSLSLYTNVSQGFSPPSLAEVLPSSNMIYTGLRPESGTNVEIGARNDQAKKLNFDITLYQFWLENTIVPRTVASGQEFFINAGKTNQRGVEVQMAWRPITNANGFFSSVKFWNSYTYSYYRFVNYSSASEDISGNKLTGIPPTVNTFGADIMFLEKGYLHSTLNFVDHIPLNDANTFFSKPYVLVGARAGYKFELRSNSLEVFTGINNMLNETYSLGNDLNARGNRFFNSAAPRNFFAGITLDIL